MELPVSIPGNGSELTPPEKCRYVQILLFGLGGLVEKCVAIRTGRMHFGCVVPGQRSVGGHLGKFCESGTSRAGGRFAGVGESPGELV
jgi:hypothetical protein